MSESIDFNVLAEGLSEGITRTASVKRFAIKGNEHLFVKAVADLFRKNDEDGFWKIEAAEDGEYFVRTDIVDAETVVQASSNWSAIPDKEKKNITLSYKNIPLKKFAATEDVSDFCKLLLQKTCDIEFRKHIYAELSPRVKEVLKSEYPNFAQ